MNFKKWSDEKCRNERKRRPTYRESCKLWLVSYDPWIRSAFQTSVRTGIPRDQNEIDKNESHGPKQ